MAIEKVKKVLIVGPIEKKEKLLDTLFGLGVFHLEKVSEEILENFDNFRLAIPSRAYNDELFKVSSILKIFKEFGLEKQGFMQGFLPQDFDVDEDEFRKTVEQFPLEDFYNQVFSLRERFYELKEYEAHLLEEKKELTKFSSFPFSFSILSGSKYTSSFVGKIDRKNLDKLLSLDVAKDIFINVFWSDKNKNSIFVLYPKTYTPVIEDLIRDYRIEVLENRFNFTGYFEEEVTRIEQSLEKVKREMQIVLSKLENLYNEKRKILILEDYFRSLSNKEEKMSHMLLGREVLVARGYVKDNDLNLLTEAVYKIGFVSFESEIEDSDVVPVSLRNVTLFRPFEFLIRLFGLPSYGNIDPTVVVAILFTIFFGFALGDAGYGIILTICSALFVNKYRKNVGAWKFFMMLFYGGIMSTIVGLLTNSFFGNLFGTYFPHFIFTRFLSNIAVVDPTSPTGAVQFMLLSIAIGFGSEMLGILISVIVKIRKKCFLDAIFNGIGWLLFLPGLVLLFLGGHSPTIKLVDNILLFSGLAFVLIGGWISIRTPLFKPIAALVNLYGIRSSYGISGFLGDTLSYLRLFALSLSSSILASSFNLMAKVIGNMLGPVGFFVTVIILLGLHTLAFFMNVLGGFIHSMRLNFLEFFGRFYDLGGYEFNPLGFEFKNIRLNKNVRR